MILRRIGSKAKIAKEIIKYFPKHISYIELFFGCGGLYFNKPFIKKNFLNDSDSNVYNCFDMLLRHKNELREYLEFIPYHIDFWNECKTRTPDNNIEKAVYFLVLSNFGYMGMPETLTFNLSNSKQILINNIEKTYKILANNHNQFLNCDFRDVLSKISFSDKTHNAFIYSDPPYFETNNNYESEKWTEQDVKDCFDVTFNSGFKAAMSEFQHPFIIEQAKQRGLNINIIGERRSLKNVSTEILITNYDKINKNLFD